jgi:hypothetical protein
MQIDKNTILDLLRARGLVAEGACRQGLGRQHPSRCCGRVGRGMGPERLLPG